jgi:hypothetical protein
MFVPIILGSDKTTVSVATGGTEYYPLYASIGNTHNGLRRAHQNALVLIGFLSVPKGRYPTTYFIAVLTIMVAVARADADTDTFCNFKRQLFHSSVANILSSLKPGMTLSVVLMATFDVPSMVSAHTLQVIKNRLLLPVLSRGGVLSKYISLSVHHGSINVCLQVYCATR